MKIRVYFRVAKKGKNFMVDCSKIPKYDALSTSGQPKKYFPTVHFATDIDIPDKEFDAARKLLDIKISETKPCITIDEVDDEAPRT